MQADVLIVGAGIAGLTVASELRAQGFTGAIILVGEEPHAPYDRPPLSKLYLTNPENSGIDLRFLDASAGQLISGDRVTGVFADEQYAKLDSGRSIEFGSLILATGSSARRPHMDSGNIPSLVLRTKSDADYLRANLVTGSHLTIIGGGIIGLEVAATARALGVEVDVVELSSRLLGRAAAPELAAILQKRHESEGVRFRFNVTSTVQDGIVLFSDGSSVETDTILWATGAVPNDDLAEAAGIECDNGILVDETGRTSKAGVFAIGDVARYRNTMQRNETWTSAREQAETVARVLIDPEHKPSATVPYYWTDQFNHKVHVLGVPVGDENIVKQTSHDSSQCVIYHMIEQKLRGVSLVDNPGLLMPAKRVLSRRLEVAADRIAQPGFNLRDLL